MFKIRKYVLLMAALSTKPGLVCADANGETSNKACTDSDGQSIDHGNNFIPDLNDACKSCQCDNGYPILCHTAACSPPLDCLSPKVVPRTCCKFECKDSRAGQPPFTSTNTTVDGSPSTDNETIANLSLRLVASSVTSLLVLALLLFMVHRLRQRRLMLAMRRLEIQVRQQGEEDEANNYIPASFLHIQCPPYEDPPPPYSSPKPCHILPQEMPPPYQEVEGDLVARGIDTNTNSSFNNNTNNNSVHPSSQLQPDIEGRGQGQERWPPGAQFNVFNIMDAFDVFHVSGVGEMLPALPTSSRSSISNNSSGSTRGEETEMQIFSQRDGLPCERSCISSVLLPLDIATLCPPSSFGASDWTHKHIVGIQPDDCAQRLVEGCRQGSGDVTVSNRPASTSRAEAKKTGHGCSLSAPFDVESSRAGVELDPKPMSFHMAASVATPTVDSSVQTQGSYTASLSQNRTRGAEATGPGNGDRDKNRGSKRNVEVVTSQGKLTKSLGCHLSIQHNHRLLQEELRRNLPPAFVNGSSQDRLHARGTVGKLKKSAWFKQIVTAETNSKPCAENANGDGECCAKNFNQPHKISSCLVQPDTDTHTVSSSALLNGRTLPRSQSCNSALSVCSETGEVKGKEGPDAEMHGIAVTEVTPVLHNDSQYPQHALPPMFLAATALAHDNSGTRDPPLVISCSHFNHSYPSSSSQVTSEEALSCGKAKTFGGTLCRTVSDPTASLELRTGQSATGVLAQSVKSKHKKLHFLPIEKNKTLSSRSKEKGKKSFSKESEGITCDKPLETECGVTHNGEVCTTARMYQPKLADIVRGRLSVAAAPDPQSVKLYGFLDKFSGGEEQVGFPELAVDDVSREKPNSAWAPATCGLTAQNCRPAHHGMAMLHQHQMPTPASQHQMPTPAPQHQMPTPAPQHQMPTPAHQCQGAQGQVGRRGLAANSLRPKALKVPKARRLSGELVAKPGHDPSDPAAVASLVPHRRGQTLHLKKSRQSYPGTAPPSDTRSTERKVAFVDLAFVGRFDDRDRPCVSHRKPPHPSYSNLNPKVSSSEERNTSANTSANSRPSGLCTSHDEIVKDEMSSYV